MANVTINNEKNGIEVRFDNKPDSTVLDVLRNNGFHWSNKQKMWYAKQTPKRMEIVNGISSFTIKTKAEQPQKYILWEMTRTENIENNFEKYKIYDSKEIAAIIRKHIRARFPMCKFSVTSDYQEINISLLASPFAKDSEEVKAIVHYVYMFAESYNYDNSDSMTDYFDVNFYGVYENGILSYKYEQTEETVSTANISAAFREEKAKYEKTKQEEEEKRLQERMAQMEIERVEAAKREEIRKENHAKIEDERLKEVMYKLLTEVDGIHEQFNRAGFEEGQKVTIIHINDFGGMSVSHVLFKSYMFGEYAQYKNAVKMTFRPERKRNDYYKWFYKEVIIIDGWIDLPENLLWEITASNGMIYKKSRFSSCDKNQFDVILEYLKENNAKVLVNTYKTHF